MTLNLSGNSSSYSEMISVNSYNIEVEEVDLSGLVESAVDSDEEDLVESMDNLTVRDAVRDCLEKDPLERSEADIETLLEFTQGLKAFTNITLTVRRALCSVMVFAVVDNRDTIVMSDGEELDSWSVLINGNVEVQHSDGNIEELQMGDSFGILPTMDKLYHRGVMRTKCDDCQFVCITQTDYYRIQHLAEANIRRYEDENGRIELITELRHISNDLTSATNRGQVVIRGSVERLLLQLVEENSMTDPTYVEDFLLTYRIIIKKPQDITQKLLEWFQSDRKLLKDPAATSQEIRDRVARVVVLWVSSHFTDFDTDYEMMKFLEAFECLLEQYELKSQLRLLHIACEAKARKRIIVLMRSSREENLNFEIVGGSSGHGIFVTHVQRETKAQDVGLKRGDQILEVNGQSFEHATIKQAMEFLMTSTHLSITVKSNLSAFKEITCACNTASSTQNCLKLYSLGIQSQKQQIYADIAESYGYSEFESSTKGSNKNGLNILETRRHLSTVDQVDVYQPSSGFHNTSSQSIGNFASSFLSNSLQGSNPSAGNCGTLSLNEDYAQGNDNQSKGGRFMAIGPKRKIQNAIMKISLLQKSSGVSSLCAKTRIQQSKLSVDESLNQKVICSLQKTSATEICHSLFHSQSNPDLKSICYDEATVASSNYLSAIQPSAASKMQEYPDHVIKVFKSDQTCKYLLINKETTAQKVVILALQEFGIHEATSNYSLCEVSVGEGGMVKQSRLPVQLQNLAERIGLSSRYYLKTNGITETLVSDDLALELMRGSTVHLLQLNAYELAIQLTLKDFLIFRKIESTEYVDDLFQLRSKYGFSNVTKFSELVNYEMFWVITEVCSEHSIVRRSKIIKQFVKIARHCKECRNFNSMFAIVSGLGHAAVSRLRQTWEKLPLKYQQLFSDLQDLMDPSRNMSKYRQLVSFELLSQQPVIPFYPIVKKDLTFIHLGNETYIDNLINFEKLRMIAKEVRVLRNMCSTKLDLTTVLGKSTQLPSSEKFLSSSCSVQASNSTCFGINHVQASTKRRKKSTALPNAKKMFEEAQMIRRVKSYLESIKIINDEDVLQKMSLECEPAFNSLNFNFQHGNSTSSLINGSGSLRSGSDQISAYSRMSLSSEHASTLPLRKRHLSPTLSTTSSTSDHNRRHINNACSKFGSASPKAVKKILSLSETTKIRNYQPRNSSIYTNARHIVDDIITSNLCPNSHRRVSSGSNVQGEKNVSGVGRSIHERSHSDTPVLVPLVELSVESSSVTPFCGFPIRKSTVAGSATSSGNRQRSSSSYAHHDRNSVY